MVVFPLEEAVLVDIIGHRSCTTSKLQKHGSRKQVLCLPAQKFSSLPVGKI